MEKARRDIEEIVDSTETKPIEVGAELEDAEAEVDATAYTEDAPTAKEMGHDALPPLESGEDG